MDIGTIIVIVAIVVAVAGFVAWKSLRGSSEKREQKRKEQEEAEVQRQAEREQRKREEWVKEEELRRAEEAANVEARERMVIASEELEDAQRSFHAAHLQLIELLQEQAKLGCDAQFQQRFGITRRSGAATPEEDPEVQEYLRANYAALRDQALDIFAESLVQAEVDRRLAAVVAEEDGEEEILRRSAPQDDKGAAPQDDEGAAPQDDKGTATQDDDGAPRDDDEEAAPQNEEAARSDEGTAPEDLEAAPCDEGASLEEASTTLEDSEAADTPEDTTEPNSEADTVDARTAIEEQVRSEYDFDSARTYGLAAISAHFNEEAELIGDIPWPAYTKTSAHGYGELHLLPGAPTEAQDDYRDFAWKKFHTGRRTERALHGEYSWGSDHLLGDADAGLSVETPAGTLTIEGPNGPLALREMHHCPWMRHDLAYQELLLVPNGQRTVFASLLGLRKGDHIRVNFAASEPFLQPIESASFTLAAIGEREGVFVGLTASNPEAASPGDAPYELVEQDESGFTFELTADARPYDVDTFPQFVEATIAWCSEPAPKPERLIRHVTR